MPQATTKIDKIKEYNAAQESKRNVANNGATANNAVPASTGEKRSKDTTDKKNATQPVSDNRRIIQEKAAEDPLEQQRLRDEEQRDREETERIDAVEALTAATSNLIDNVNARVNPVKDWIARQPTPGGILALIAFIMFFVFAAIPVNQMGQTRLYLLWQTLLGRTHMQYRESTPIGEVNSSGIQVTGASGTFGDAYTPPTTSPQVTQSILANGNITPLNLSGLFGIAE